MDKKTDKYRTLLKESKGLFKDRGSKFIALAFPVKTEPQVKEILKELQKEYHDARHHCYAYKLGPEGKDYRANDDGEPSSSAGKPILGQLNSFEITDVLIVVIRYFGGTLLGVPGLINAYRSAAKDAITNNEIVEKTVKDKIRIKFEYPEMDHVMRIIKNQNAKIINQAYDNSCIIDFEIRRNLTTRIINELEKVNSLELFLKNKN